MKALTKELIKDVPDLKYKKVEVPEWEAYVILKEFDLQTRMLYYALLQDLYPTNEASEDKERKLTAEEEGKFIRGFTEMQTDILAQVIVDEKTKRPFLTKEDLMGRSASVISRLFDEVKGMNSVFDVAQEKKELVKDS